MVSCPSCPMARPKRLGKSYVWLESPSGELQITMGPHWPGVIAVILMIMGGTWMTFTLIENIPTKKFIEIFLFRTSSVFFFSTTIAALLMTACSDPGIVRVTPVSTEEDVEDIDGTPYCEVCSIYQPDRLNIRHCYDCDVCIIGLDHHCPWMGKCIGRKNMKWFIVFNALWVCYFFQLLVLCFGLSRPVDQ